MRPPSGQGARIIFRCRDRWGREIILTARRWHGKILAKHGELRGHEATVRKTLTDPLIVNLDVNYNAATRQVENYYRVFQEGPPPYNRTLVKVCVRFRRNWRGRRLIGQVITAYSVTTVKAGEMEKWRQGKTTSSS